MSLQTALIRSLIEKTNNEIETLGVQAEMLICAREFIENKIINWIGVSEDPNCTRVMELKDESVIITHQIRSLKNRIEFCESICNELDAIDQAQVDLFIELTQGLDPLSTDHRIRELVGSKQ